MIHYNNLYITEDSKYLFKKFIDKAFEEKGRGYSILEEYSLPEDFAVTEKFREGNYLKVVFVKKH